MLNKIIGVIIIVIALTLGVFYFNEELNMTYLYDHHTSWLIILIQVTALIFAIREYKKWKNQVYSRSEHDRLLGLFESVTELKNAIIEFDEASEQSIKLNQIIEKMARNDPESDSEIDRAYRFYNKLWDLYDNLISEVLVSVETKAELVSNIYKLNDLNSKIKTLTEQAKLRRKLIENSSPGEDSKKSDVNQIFREIKNQIEKDSNILD